MHLILALSVIILQHVDSYSCRSILRTLDNLNSKSIEDSSESYELRNEDIMELLQPFLELKPEENMERQQLQKNLAKLTIEPYLDKNRTRKGPRSPFNNLNKRKTIAPLAIILTNLSDLKLKQTDHKIKNEKSVNENSLDAKDVSNDILHHLINADKQQQNSDEITNINNDKNKYISPHLKSNEEDKDETLKPVTGKKVKMTTGSPDPVSIEGKDLNNSDNNEEYEGTVKSEVKDLIEELTNEGISNEIARLTAEGVKISKDDYSSDDNTLYLTDLESKDLNDSTEDKLQTFVDEVSEAYDSLAEDKQLSRELIPPDINARDMDEEKLIDEEDYDRIKNSLEKTSIKDRLDSIDFGGQTLKIINRNKIIPDSNKSLSKEDDYKNVFASHQEFLHNLQKDSVLEEQEPNKEDNIETLIHQKGLQSSGENIFLGSSKELNKEYGKENSQSHRKYLHIVLKDDEDEENPLKSSQKHLHNLQEHILLETDEELSKEDVKEKSINGHQKQLHILRKINENHENWHHDIDDGHPSFPHKTYNLYFRFKR